MQTKEEVIQMLEERAALLGRRPKKTDVTRKELSDIRKICGKWCYALEDAGLVTPSEKTLKRRANAKRKMQAKRKKPIDRV